ncbi:MAG: hypothetical protein IT375_10120 [Polyangiaceae bacterium]|nr:hypothetical protein [Polyangiaceae bacterium]
MISARVALLALALPLTGCPSKEAEDPKSILGDWTEHQGVEGTTGARAKPEPRTAAGQGAPAERLATQLECEAAVRRIEELGMDLAIKEADDPEERRALELRKKKLLQSPEHAARVKDGTEECLSRDTTKSEALCIARAKSELDVDRCSGQ